MFVPVKVTVGAGEGQGTQYHRGFELVGERLQAFGQHAQDMTGPMRAIADSIHLNVSAQFATQGAAGVGWQPLSEPYASWKSSHSFAPILVGLKPLHKGSRAHPSRPEDYEPSGKMRLSLLDPLAAHVTSKRMLYAPDSEIAGYHETGTANMPARPPLVISPLTLHSWDLEFARWIQGLVERSGL